MKIPWEKIRWKKRMLVTVPVGTVCGVAAYEYTHYVLVGFVCLVLSELTAIFIWEWFNTKI